MSKGLTADIAAQLALDSKRPTYLYTIELTYTTLRFAAYKTDVEFPSGGNTYQAKAVKHEIPVQSINHSSVQKAKISFADGEGAMLGFHRADNFKGKRITCKRIYRDEVDSANDRVELLEGYVNRIGGDYKWFTIEMSCGDTLRQKLPKWAYTERCPYSPGNDECNADGNFDLTSSAFYKTEDDAMTGDGDTFTAPNRVEADDYWNAGIIILQHGSNVYQRKVLDFASGVFTLDHTTGISGSVTIDTYEVWKGCDGSWACCSGDFAYGPSADNSDNYGGCLHIPNTEKG